MLEINRDEVRSIIAGQRHHPEDDEVLYVRGNEPWIGPVLRTGFIKAVVVPVDKSVLHTAVTATVLDDEIEHLQEQDLYRFENNQLFVEGNGMPVTTYHVPAVCHEHMIRTAAALEPLREDGRIILLEALAYPSGGNAKYGRFPNLHSDHPYSANTTIKGNPMKFLIGAVGPEEQDFINQFGNGLHSVFERALAERFKVRPDWESRLRSFELGDLVIFNDRLNHCSDVIAPNGQLAFNAYPKI